MKGLLGVLIVCVALLVGGCQSGGPEPPESEVIFEMAAPVTTTVGVTTFLLNEQIPAGTFDADGTTVTIELEFQLNAPTGMGGNYSPDGSLWGYGTGISVAGSLCGGSGQPDAPVGHSSQKVTIVRDGPQFARWSWEVTGGIDFVLPGGPMAPLRLVYFDADQPTPVRVISKTQSGSVTLLSAVARKE